MSLTRYIKSKIMWIILLGIGLTGLGLFSIEKAVIADNYSVTFLGVLFAFAGVLQLAEGLRTRKWNGSFFNVVQGALYILGGFSMYARFSIYSFNVTLTLAFFYVGMALLRIFFATLVKFKGRAWVLFSGIVSMLCAIVLMVIWPSWSILIIGLIAGADLIFYGISMLAFSVGIRSIKEAPEESPHPSFDKEH